MDPAGLFHEETYTDRKIGSIRMLTPVTVEGTTDTARQPLFLGQTQVMTPAGALPLSFEIPAKTLKEAMDEFAKAADQALERTVRELQEMQREAASQIVVPEMGGSGLLGPGGGKFR
ncbi:MAG: hypothetical protein HY272_10445 [Gammaproteobacteria bacterium]|nr:hypothetical protein [Gammaproteobacteria bacterium]